MKQFGLHKSIMKYLNVKSKKSIKTSPIVDVLYNNFQELYAKKEVLRLQ